MTTSQVDLDTATVSRTLRIDAPPSLVWAVLTSPDQIAQWFGQSATFPDGVHAGATGTFGWTDVAAHRAAMADHAEGWERELDELVAHVRSEEHTSELQSREK